MVTPRREYSIIATILVTFTNRYFGVAGAAL